MGKDIVKYICFLLPCLIAEIVAVILAPVLALMQRDGYLPSFLSWFQTPDNTLYGDNGWAEYWNSKGMTTYGWLPITLWLIRNRAYGFKWDVLGVKVDRYITYSGDPDINRNNGRFGVLKVRHGNDWQWKLVKPIFNTGYCLMLNFGWLFDAYIGHPYLSVKQPKALFMFSPRMAKIKNK